MLSDIAGEEIRVASVPDGYFSPKVGMFWFSVKMSSTSDRRGGIPPFRAGIFKA
jgi:hypothetical protein